MGALGRGLRRTDPVFGESVLVQCQPPNSTRYRPLRPKAEDVKKRISPWLLKCRIFRGMTPGWSPKADSLSLGGSLAIPKWRAEVENAMLRFHKKAAVLPSGRPRMLAVTTHTRNEPIRDALHVLRVAVEVGAQGAFLDHNADPEQRPSLLRHRDEAPDGAQRTECRQTATARRYTWGGGQIKNQRR